MLKKILLLIGIFGSVVLVSWGILSSNGNKSPQGSSQAVREENGVQYIRILARGGYSPRYITAKANIPTVLEIETKGTYDCSSAITIPQLRYQKFLSPSGITTIEVPQNLAVNTLHGLCVMGMYGFTVDFHTST